MCLIYNLAISYDRCSYFSSLLFLYPKTEFVSSFAFVLCSPFPSADWAFLDCVIVQKVRDIIFEAILSPPERYQNIQDNPEYNSILTFRIILKIFAVNVLREYKMKMYNFECSCKPMVLFYTRWTLSKNCPSRKFFLVCTFSHLDWIRKLRTKSPWSFQMQENTDQKKLRIWTFFTQWKASETHRSLMFCGI